MTLPLSNPALFIERAFIGGAWVGATSGASVPVDNPATGAIIGLSLIHI